MENKYTVTTRENLIQLCIKNNWFTCGRCEQYEKLFYANEHGASIEEIATIIWLCSSEEHCSRNILSALKERRDLFYSLCCGE